MINSFGTRKSGGWLLRIALCMVLVIWACDDSRTTETALFEAAEVDYRDGHYSEAISGYYQFLERYPQSPLAATAEIRLRNIHREVSSVMDTSNALRPSYHGFDGEQSPPTKPPQPAFDEVYQAPPTDTGSSH